MRAHVLGERGAVGEGFGANPTAVRSFPIVSAHVRSDGRRLGKLAATDVTLEWLFTGVYAEVRCEISSL